MDMHFLCVWDFDMPRQLGHQIVIMISEMYTLLKKLKLLMLTVMRLLRYCKAQDMR